MSSEPSSEEFSMLVMLAEEVEQESRQRRPLEHLLDRLEDETDRARLRSASGSPTVEHPSIERWRRVVAAVRRDVESGRVRSVTGIAREARRLGARVEAATGIAASS